MPDTPRPLADCLHHAPAPSPAFQVVLVNLSAEGCCILAPYPIEAQSPGIARLFQCNDCIRTRIAWIDTDLAALTFEERLSEATFTRFAETFLHAEGIGVGNPHAGQDGLSHLLSPEMKRRLWRLARNKSPRSQFILDLTSDLLPDGRAIRVEHI